MRFFPKVDPAGPIDAEVRASAVDYVNRVNWLFETRDLPGMIASFTSDARIVHFHGTLSGEDEVRHFPISGSWRWPLRLQSHCRYGSQWGSSPFATRIFWCATLRQKMRQN